jgi:hypothetical protein
MCITPENMLGIAYLKIGGVLFLAEVIVFRRLVAVTWIGFYGVHYPRNKRHDDQQSLNTTHLPLLEVMYVLRT